VYQYNWALYVGNFLNIDDFSHQAGDTIEVIKKDGDWWTGRIGDRVGVFPFNYVQPVDGEVS